MKTKRFFFPRLIHRIIVSLLSILIGGSVAYGLVSWALTMHVLPGTLIGLFGVTILLGTIAVMAFTVTPIEMSDDETDDLEAASIKPNKHVIENYKENKEKHRCECEDAPSAKSCEC